MISAAPASAAMRSLAAARPAKVHRAPEPGDSASPRVRLTPMVEEADSAAPRAQVSPLVKQEGSALPGAPVTQSDSPLRMAVVQVPGSIRAPAPREGPA